MNRFFLMFVAASAFAANPPMTSLPALSNTAWADKPNPYASIDSVRGGSISVAAFAVPKSLNYYLSNDSFAAQVFSLMYESLLGGDPVTGDHAPGIAQRWEVSKDKSTYTFFINPMARWSDGKPITAEDVKWTFDAVTSPTNQTGAFKVALRPFTGREPIIVNPLTISFTASEVHWRNLGAIGGMPILPKHAYEGRDFNKINSDFPVVSGPYQIAENKEGVSLSLQSRDDWWGRGLRANRNMYNFKRITYKFYADQDNAFDAFLAGETDIYAVYRAAIWRTRTSGSKKFDMHWIAKQSVKNHDPIGFQGFAMNMRKPPFDDLRVRKAMALLLDRKRMNETLMHNQYFLHKSYFENLYGASNECENAVFDFDPKEAAKLLDEAGWKKDPKSKLRKNAKGEVLAFTFLTRDESSDKFLALYNESLRKAGITMKIEREDFAAWMRDMDQYKFDMTWAAWSAGLFPDPESMWSSAEADKAGGNNITGFKNEEVDAMIAEQRSEFDLEARNAVCRRIDKILTDNVPYILLWNVDATRILYWEKFGTPQTVLGKFGDETAALAYWWYDEDSAAELDQAMKESSVLPPRPDVVDFDAVVGAAE